MDQSPKGREIEPLTGDSAVIVSRGNRIEELGNQMADAANVLEQIATSELADGQMQGKAVAELQDKVGSSYTTLREASELYTPVGPLIAAYGESLGELQDKMGPLVDSCTDKWAAYEALPGDREEDDAEGQAKETAYNDWHGDAESWDSHYDTWDEAYELAVSGISDEMAGSIKDGFWEIFDFIIGILEIVAMVFMLAGILLGGVVAIIGFAIGAAVLVGRVVQMAAGKCEIHELVLAIVAVLPFGKIGQIGKAWKELGKGATAASKFRVGLSISTGAKEIPRTKVAWMANPFKGPKEIVSTAITGLDPAAGKAILGGFPKGPNQSWAAIIDGVGGAGKWANEWVGTYSAGKGLHDTRIANQKGARVSGRADIF